MTLDEFEQTLELGRQPCDRAICKNIDFGNCCKYCKAQWDLGFEIEMISKLIKLARAVEDMRQVEGLVTAKSEWCTKYNEVLKIKREVFGDDA